MHDCDKCVCILRAPPRSLVRALDTENFLRVYLDMTLTPGNVVVEVMMGGTLTRLTDAPATLLPDTWYQLALSLNGPVLTVYFNGALLLTTSYSASSMGWAGVYAGTSALFDDFSFVTPCSSCSNAGPQDSCTFGCTPGLLSLGNTTRTCSLDGSGVTASWGGSPLVCTMPSPVMFPAARSVPERSAVNTLVGVPIIATLLTASVSLTYSITGGNVDPSTGLAPFWIDGCSGQIRVLNAVLNWELTPTYTVNVTALVVGFPSATTTVPVSISVTFVQGPPNIGTQTLNVSEAAPIGNAVGRMYFMDYYGFQKFNSPGPNGTVAFAITLDGSAGMFGFSNATTGAVTLLNNAALDYESGVTRYSMVVSGTLVSQPSLIGTGTLVINVIDAPDVPTVPLNQIISISDLIANNVGPGAALSPPLAASLQDNPAGRYNSTLVFTLLTPALSSSKCGVNATVWPTTTGAQGGTPLFSINASSGLLSVSARPVSPLPAWPNAPLVPVLGQLTRASYTLCVNVSSAYKFNAVKVNVLIVADLSGVSAINGLYVNAVNGTGNAALTDTRGGSQLFFTGAGFPNSTIPRPASVNASCTNGVYTFVATGCSVVTSNLIQCTVPPGVGAGLTWTVWVNAVVVPSSVPLVTSYFAPIVTAIYNATSLPSLGGMQVYVQGQYFGVVSLPAIPYVKFEYGAGTTGPLSGSSSSGCFNTAGAAWPYQYGCTVIPTPVWGARQDSWLRCTSAPGAGAVLQWRLTVGGQVVESTSTAPGLTLAYQPPIITAMAPTPPAGGGNASYGLLSLDTAGGQSITISGSGLGGHACNTVSGTYSNGAGGLGPYPLTGCVHGAGAAYASTLVCLTSPGVGTLLAVSLTVDGTTSASNVSYGSSGSQVLGYRPPVLTGVSGNVRSNPTLGGSTLILLGSQFGPVASPVDYVAYGPGNSSNWMFRLGAGACTVTSFTRIACTMMTGAGTNYSLQASVGGQVREGSCNSCCTCCCYCCFTSSPNIYHYAHATTPLSAGVRRPRRRHRVRAPRPHGLRGRCS